MVEGAPHTAKRSRDQLLCLEVPPCPRTRGEEAAGQGRARQGGVLLPPGVGLPLFLVGVGGGKEGKEREEGKGGTAPLLVQFRLEGEGARGQP